MNLLIDNLVRHIDTKMDGTLDRPIHFSSSAHFLNAIIANNLLKKTNGRVYVIYPSEEEVRLRERDYNLINNETYLCLNSFGINIGQKPKLSKNYIYSFKKYQESPHSIVLLSSWALSLLYPKINKSESESMKINLNDTISFSSLTQFLTDIGMQKVPKVNDNGEFTFRGEVIDIFPFASDEPVRIYLDFDKVTRISTFDPLSGRSKNELNELIIPKYTPINEEEEVSYCFLTEYFNKDDIFIFVGEEKIKESYKHIVNMAKDSYKERYSNNEKVSFDMILPDIEEYFKSVGKDKIFLVHDIIKQENNYTLLKADGPRSYFGAFNIFKDELISMLERDWVVYIFASGILQKDRLETMLRNNIDNNMLGKVRVINGTISEGFSLSELKLIVFSDEEIFKRRNFVKSTLSRIETSVIDSFVELNEGDIVVHINYGIAKFIKLDRITVQGVERDYIKLEFKDKEFYYVPIQMANLIHKYIGNQEKVQLSSLSSRSWSLKKEKALKSAEELAKELINLYAIREKAQAFAHTKDTEWQYMFEAGFCREETRDQLNAISDIKTDMEAPKIMDRLLCGDVGFGKTEVAFRAAFKAIMSAKQVAFLSPTTILTHQHYKNFKARVSAFPIEVRELSRTVHKSEITKTLKDLEENNVDIVFGTHRLLQKDVNFKNLGLLIIDEEQRFGVKDKEKIKKLKTNVDTLALSATPIPRTLYMSMLKLRDISTIKSAPLERKSVNTYIGEFDKELVREAINRELERGGQVFYLHNRVEDIYETLAFVKNLVPGVIAECAHGSMNGDELEDIMETFVNGGIQVLICTTIIENGIDIPRANTLIIDNATIYGASQLYQLRGRVGRSQRQAYAYLLYKNENKISEDAVNRLKLISESLELGSGFKVAMRDMELRGAGNILGSEQSGFISSVGLDMYIRLLDESVKRLEGNEEFSTDEIYLDIQTTSFIPDSYIEDTSEKFEVYKKIASCQSEEEYNSVTAMVSDRFGNPPNEVLSLFYIALLKIIAKKLYISSIIEKNKQIFINFEKVSKINIDRLLLLINTSANMVKFNPKNPSSIIIDSSKIDLMDKSLFLSEKLSRLL